MKLSSRLWNVHLILSFGFAFSATFCIAEAPQYTRSQIKAAKSLPTPIPMLGDFRTALPNDPHLSAFVSVDGVWKAHNWEPDIKADKHTRAFEYSADLSVWSWSEEKEQNEWRLIAKSDHHRRPQWWTFSPTSDSYAFKIDIADEYARLGELEVSDFDSGRFLARIPACGDRRSAKGSVLCSWVKTSSIRIVGLTATGKKLFELCASNGHPDGYWKTCLTSKGFDPFLPSSSIFLPDNGGSLGVIGNADDIPVTSSTGDMSIAETETEFVNDSPNPITIKPPKDFEFAHFRIINKDEFSKLLGMKVAGLVPTDDPSLPDSIAKWLGVEDNTPAFKGYKVPPYTKGKIRWHARLCGLSLDVFAWPMRADWYGFKKAGTIHAVLVPDAYANLTSIEPIYVDVAVTFKLDTPVNDDFLVYSQPTIKTLHSLADMSVRGKYDGGYLLDQDKRRRITDPFIMRLKKGSTYDVSFNTTIEQSWPINQSVLGVKSFYVNTLKTPSSITIPIYLHALQELKVKVLNGDLPKDGKISLYKYSDDKYFNAASLDKVGSLTVGSFKYLSPGKYRVFVPSSSTNGKQNYADVVVQTGAYQELEIDLMKAPKM